MQFCKCTDVCEGRSTPGVRQVCRECRFDVMRYDLTNALETIEELKDKCAWLEKERQDALDELRYLRQGG